MGKIIGPGEDGNQNKPIITSGQPQDPSLQEIAAEDIIDMMKHKALCFDVLFYLTCVDKDGKLIIPKTSSGLNKKEFGKIIQMMRGILQVSDAPTFVVFKNNMAKYVGGLVKRLSEASKK